MNSNRYIITGGPGSGKSTLLEALRENGFRCFEEISRNVIREQHAIGGDKVPWQNLGDFAEICYERMSAQLEDCPPDNYCFYDRGLPDIIAYVKRGGLKVPKKYYQRSTDYNTTVFIAPPWKEIFINDSERPESFEDSKEIFKFLRSTYEALNFDIVLLPKVPVEERVEFIRQQIGITEKEENR
jgi:predicted ATPase